MQWLVEGSIVRLNFIDLFNLITRQLDCENTVDMLYLDFNKAFDKNSPFSPLPSYRSKHSEKLLLCHNHV